MILSRQAVENYLNRDFNNYAWMKRLTREDILAELNQLPVRPVFKTEPWLHQLVAFYIGLCDPRFLFLLDMGLGKSKIIQDLITQALREKRLKHALVTVPRLINIDSWMDDVAVHSDLEPNPCNVHDIEEKWERLANPRGEITLIDYQGLHWALCEKKKTSKGNVLVRNDKRVKQIQRLYNFIGIDESHKLGNHQNLWFSLMRQITKQADYVYATTGTLFGRDLEEVWSQFFLVDRGETFGENLGLFRAGFFTEEVHPWKGRTFVFNKKTSRKLHAMLQHKSLRYDETEVLDIPQRIGLTEHCLMSDEQRDHYLRAVEGVINAGGNLRDLDAAWIRMRQIVSGYLVWKDEYGDHIIHFKHNPKLDLLERLIDEMGSNSKIVVVYEYTETGRLIVERIKQMGLGVEWFYGGTKDQSASRRRFIDDPQCRVFVMQSAAGGEGTDGLQKVARYMALYETPTGPRLRQQTIKRIHRAGQRHRSFIYDLVMRHTADAGILESVAQGRDLYEQVVDGKQQSLRSLLLV